MGESYLIAGVFLGVLFLIILGLLSLYCCLKRQMCWIQKLEKKRDDDVSAGEEEAEPFMEKLESTSEEAVAVPVVAVLIQDPGTNSNTSHTNTPSGSTKSKTSTNNSVSTPMLLTKSKSSGDMKISLSLVADKSLIVIVHRLDGLQQFAERDSILVSVTCLSGRKTTKQSRLHQVQPDGVVLIGHTCKFNKLNKDLVARAQIRLRVYGKMTNTVMLCLGEAYVSVGEEKLVNGKADIEKTIKKMTARKMKLHKE